MRVTRTLHHSVNVEGELASSVEFYSAPVRDARRGPATDPGHRRALVRRGQRPAPPGRRPRRAGSHPARRAPRLLRRRRPRRGHHRAPARPASPTWRAPRGRPSRSGSPIRPATPSRSNRRPGSLARGGRHPTRDRGKTAPDDVTIIGAEGFSWRAAVRSTPTPPQVEHR